MSSVALQYSANVSMAELFRHALGVRSLSRLALWTAVALAALGFFAGAGTLRVALPMAVLFWLHYVFCLRLTLKQTRRFPYLHRAEISVDEAGVLRVDWGGWTARTWTRKQWRECRIGSEMWYVLRWPWCLFSSYSVFPGPSIGEGALAARA